MTFPLLSQSNHVRRGRDNRFTFSACSSGDDKGKASVQWKHRLVPILGAAGLALLVGGCCATKKCQLEHIAKDWCMTIRASQVIPVYPLTEDIQPGDVFLVQVPIDYQQKVYQDKGFLPLDSHLARLNPQGYTNFYANSFLAGINNPLLPRDWIHPVGTNTHYWKPAPRAAFPSYSFSIRRGAGMNLAVPVQGVPVGLSLLGSDAADGTITIKQARTMGVDTTSLWEELQSWAQKNKGFLANFGPVARNKETNYLRVVTRVYATGQMDVNLRDASSRSGGADVGAAKPVNLLFPELPQGKSNVAAVVAQNYTNGWSLLSDMLEKATAAGPGGRFLPGGSLRLAAASSRTITLQEEFNPPLILGYLGFDCAISRAGELGPPFPTHAAIQRKSRVHQAAYVYGADENSEKLRTWLHAEPSHTEAAKSWLATNAAPNLANVLTADEFRDLRKRMADELVNKP